jgi:chromosome segregation ATPase
MSIVTVTKAIKLTGKSHATIYRHIKSGKLSKSPDGGIDTAELIRVYGEFKPKDSNKNKKETPKSIKLNVDEIYQHEKSETEIQHLREQLESLKSQLSKTESQLERSQEKEDKLLQLIENRLPPPDDNNSVVNRLKRKFL